MWIFQDKEFILEDISEFEGFVYIITDKTNGKKYVGKKNFHSRRKLAPLKGKTRKRSIVKESDWQEYYGSNDAIKVILEQDGKDRFHREILHLCKSKGEMSYMEAKEQFDRNVLFSDEYYNAFIGVKIHASHVSGMKDKLQKSA